MLYLLFKAGDNNYAIRSSQVVEIIPRISVRRLPRAPRHIAGVFEYRGELIPTIDLCELLCQRPSANIMSTRIVIVQFKTFLGVTRKLGLTAEKVVDTFETEKSKFQQSGVSVEQTPYLGEFTTHNDELTQVVDPEHLLPMDLQKTLFVETQ